MNDKKNIYDELLLYLGQPELPGNLQKAVEEDEEIRQYWLELQNTSQKLGNDDDFLPSNIDADSFIDELNERIDTSLQTKRTPEKVITYSPSFYKWAGVAAMFILVAGISIFSLFFNRENGEISSVTIDNRAIAYYLGLDPDISIDNYDTTLTLSDNEFQVLVDNYTSQEPYQSLEGVIDDISEEEFEYLQKNFDVGDLL